MARRINPSVLVIPSVDIFLLVVVFMFLSGAFLYQSAVTVELPKTITHSIVSQDNPTVTLTPGGGIFLSGRKVSREGLSILLQYTVRLSEKRGGEVKLIIRADENVNLKHLAEVIEDVKKIGIKHIAIATER